MITGEERKAPRQSTMLAIINSSTESTQSLEDTCGSENSSSQETLQNLSRTSLLLLDYKHFRAARTIQRSWRRFYYRTKFANRTKAAVTIQRWWRGFSVRNNHFRFVENMLQGRLERYYNQAATKIQALFRGWRIRQTVHDNDRLLRMQICAAEDLLNCVAFKLHHLLRTHAIPGVYSLRNSNCLSRVEKLLASLHFRFHNGRVKSQIPDQKAEENIPTKCKCRCNVPQSKTQYWSQCKAHCYDNLRMCKEMDRHMYKIIEMYDAAQKKANAALQQQRWKHRKNKKLLANIKKSAENNKRDFCGDVIASMRRWKFLVQNQLNVDKNVFRNPENLENFLIEISEFAKEYDNCSCYCHIPVFDEIYCR